MTKSTEQTIARKAEDRNEVSREAAGHLFLQIETFKFFLPWQWSICVYVMQMLVPAGERSYARSLSYSFKCKARSSKCARWLNTIFKTIRLALKTLSVLFIRSTRKICLEKRCRERIEPKLANTRSGFRLVRSSANQIFTLQQIFRNLGSMQKISIEKGCLLLAINSL